MLHHVFNYFDDDEKSPLKFRPCFTRVPAQSSGSREAEARKRTGHHNFHDQRKSVVLTWSVFHSATQVRFEASTEIRVSAQMG